MWNSGGIKTFVHSYKPLKYLNRNSRVKNNKNVKVALSIPPLTKPIFWPSEQRLAFERLEF